MKTLRERTAIPYLSLLNENRLNHLRKDATVYLLTPLRRVLLEKLSGSQLVKKFPAFHGTRRFITAFTSASYLYLS